VNRGSLIFVMLLFSAFIGCSGRGRVLPAKPEYEIVPLKIVPLDNEVVDFCADDTRLLLLDISGTRVLAVDTGFSTVETIPISIRVTSPRGIYADRYYIYVYNDRALFRMAKDKLILSALLNNVRIAGLAVYAPGELLVSDEERQTVWLKTIFGESRNFLDRSDLARPRDLTVFPGGIFGVISGEGRLWQFNRAGIFISSLPIPPNMDLLGCDREGRAYTMQRGETVIWLVEDKKTMGYELKGVVSPMRFVFIGEKMFVLDSGRRIAVYSVPSI